jgi:hypothetical protein
VLETSLASGALKIERKDGLRFIELMDFVLKTNLEERIIISFGM